MKITHIETIALRDPALNERETLVRVHTDAGLTGIGQAESPSLVIDAIIRCQGGLEDVVRGEDPLQVERLWSKMYTATGLYGRRGVTMAAIGAVETALWDIAGQAQGVPVSQLIWRSFAMAKGNNEIRRQVTPYATVYPPGETPDEIVERFGKAVSMGFRAVKLEEWQGGFGQGSLAINIALTKLVRETIGPDRELFIDVQNQWQDVATAVATIRAVEPFRVGFIEAPLPADNLEGYARLADTVQTPIAVGDWGFSTRFEFEALMTTGRVDIVQPSTVRAGGISEILKIAEAAYRRGLLCIPHCWCHMVGVAAATHLAAVIPNMPYIEYPLAFPDSPIISGLLDPPLAPDADGMISVSRRPGLGYSLNEDVVQRYRVEPY